MFTPVTSEGWRSGVHWMRAKTESSIERAIARASTVLPGAGHVLEEHVAVAGEGGDDELDLVVLAAQDELDVRGEPRRDRGRALELGVRGRDLPFRPHRGIIAGRVTSRGQRHAPRDVRNGFG